jgi:S-adenosylmethionine hydrolase
MNERPLIVLLTDFGLQDVYVGLLKAAIARINPQLAGG